MSSRLIRAACGRLAACAVVAGARFTLSTYRVQFNGRFIFSDAHAGFDYFDSLGVSDRCASSHLKAVPGSPHGYDVADPTRFARFFDIEWRPVKDELADKVPHPDPRRSVRCSARP